MTRPCHITKTEWLEVFHIRCRSKRGERVTDEELALCERARVENRKRYIAMDGEIFELTRPFGSSR